MELRNVIFQLGALPASLIDRLSTNRFGPLVEYLRARDGLPAVRRLIVLPSYFVAGLPVELIAPSGVEVSYAPSGSLFAYLKNLPNPASQVALALGDPVFDAPGSTRYEFNSLPGTAVEVEQLRRRFERNQQPVLSLQGMEASEPTLAEMAAKGELKKYRYLHFATHGVIDHERPSRSALILSQVGLPDPAEQFDKGLPIYDGRVTVEEIVEQWELDADLVVLSACETALGRHAGGEGFIGFAQALLTAGARSVVLSLWKVDDMATALLMDRFYANLLGQTEGLLNKEPMPKAEALSEAKRWLRELPKNEAEKLIGSMSAGVERGKGRPSRVDPNEPPKPANVPDGEKPYSHPFYWAAFILIGDPD
jgi:CHAT domain-containing protein